MSQLFLDANILLDFYRFGDDDISEIRKIITLISGMEIELITNKHLLDEVLRNREKVISDSLAEVQSLNFRLKSPNYGKDLPEYKVLSQQLKEANKTLDSFVKSMQQMISDRTLPADTLLKDLFSASTAIDLPKNLLELAKDRLALGNPPGKKNSLGDALHWECLLSLKYGFGMDIVSRDGDFASDLNPKVAKEFLVKEWTERHGSLASVTLFRSLSEYFSIRFPQIRLSDEVRKDELIEQLMVSPNFATTHFLIAELSRFSFFTGTQVVRLFDALAQNTQVGWIGKDADVKEFYIGLRDKAYRASEATQIQCALYLEVDRDEFFLPF